MLDAVDHDREVMVDLLAGMVREPSVGGSDEENGAQARLAATMADDGLEVDHWQVPLAETLARPGFPGVEVDRREAWGLVGRLPGRGDGPSLMLQGHIDVVPAGPDAAGRDASPFSGRVVDGELHGRGACDMKGGLVAAACAADPWLRDHPVQVVWWGGQFAPGRTDPDHPLIHGLRAARARSGGPGTPVPELWGAPYGSDLRLLVGAGVPTVQFGPGDAGLAHGTQERVPMEEVLAAARTLALLAVDTCGTA